MWQDGLPENWLPSQIVDKSQGGAIRLYQEFNGEYYLAGGNTGLWWKQTAVDWGLTRFEADTPQVTTLVRVSEKQWWIATDNGVWLSTDNGKTATQIALADQFVTALVLGGANEVWGVVERSRVFKLNILNHGVEWITLSNLNQDTLPKSIDLSRLIHDVHFGRGIFNAPWSLLISDLAAIALLILPMSGLLYWWLPHIWRRKRLQGKSVHKLVKQRWAIWLYRFHAPVLGVVCAIPIIYLSITGIFLDHATGLRSLMKQTHLEHAYFTPVYDLSSWENEIYSLLVENVDSKKFSIGTRLGLFTTTDNGALWKRESLRGDAASFIWMARQFNKEVFIGGMGGPNYIGNSVDNDNWKKLPHGAHMPTDVTLSAKGQSIWKTRKGLKRLDSENGYINYKVELPRLEYVPWFYVLDGLHSGLIFHEQWKWLNDFFAIMAMLLVITGLIRWWRVKWL